MERLTGTEEIGMIIVIGFYLIRLNACLVGSHLTYGNTRIINSASEAFWTHQVNETVVKSYEIS